jgi:hypothetical protein
MFQLVGKTQTALECIISEKQASLYEVLLKLKL